MVFRKMFLYMKGPGAKINFVMLENVSAALHSNTNMLEGIGVCLHKKILESPAILEH